MTRQHLLEAAAIVFSRRGFHGATLDEVAATAGFTKGAVYSNFKNKEDLFLELFDDRVARQLAVVAEVLEGGSHETAERFPRIRELVRGDIFWSDDLSTLYLEFVLYARRHPEAQAKLAASARRTRSVVQQLIDEEYAAIGVSRSRWPCSAASASIVSSTRSLSPNRRWTRRCRCCSMPCSVGRDKMRP
jgi:AcrR family transcriptional regulator